MCEIALYWLDLASEDGWLAFCGRLTVAVAFCVGLVRLVA